MESKIVAEIRSLTEILHKGVRGDKVLIRNEI